MNDYKENSKSACSHISPFPLSQSPSQTLDYLEIENHPQEEQFLFYTLQGLVNREKSRIWIKNTRYEFSNVPDYWKPLYEKNSYSFLPVPDPWKLVRKYEKNVKGVILYDESLWNDPAKKIGLNVIASLCGIHDALPVTKSLHEILKLPVVIDTIPLFQDSPSITHYAEKEILPHCTKQLIHHSPPGVYLENTDYIVAHKVFSFFACENLEEKERGVFDRYLSHTDPVSPVIGVWAQDDRCPPPKGFMDELAFVDWLSSHSKYMVVTHSCGNLTVHTGLSHPELKQKRSPVPSLEKDVVYVTFILSDGDNTAGCMQLRPRIWKQADRGDIPVGWNWGPSLLDLCPMAARYFYETMTPDESHVAACTGYGYISPERFSDRFDKDTQRKYWEKYLALTRDGMKRMDMNVIWPWWITWEKAGYFASQIDEIRAVYLNAFPGSLDPSEGFHYLGKNVPGILNQIAADVGDEEQLVSGAKKALAAWGEKRPAFLFFGVNGFMVDYPRMKKMTEALGKSVRVVSPEHFAILYSQAYPNL